IDRGVGAIYESPLRREKITATHRSPAWVIASPDGTASRRLEVGFYRLRATRAPPASPFSELTISSGPPASWVAAWWIGVATLSRWVETPMLPCPLVDNSWLDRRRISTRSPFSVRSTCPTSASTTRSKVHPCFQ